MVDCWLVVEPTHLKNMILKLEIVPKQPNRDENKKYLKYTTHSIIPNEDLMVIYHGRKQKITTNNIGFPSSLVIFFGLPRIQVCSKDLGYAPSDLATMLTYHKPTKLIPGIRKQLPSLQMFKVFSNFWLKIRQTFYPSHPLQNISVS